MKSMVTGTVILFASSQVKNTPPFKIQIRWICFPCWDEALNNGEEMA